MSLDIEIAQTLKLLKLESEDLYLAFPPAFHIF